MNKKRGQVTIFIIIAIAIVGFGVLAFLFYPRLQTTIRPGQENPPAFIQTCIEDDIKSNVRMLSLQGGNIEPEYYTLYDNQRVEYLCYTAEYYGTCIIQQPMLKEHIENEIKQRIKENVKSCFASLKREYERRGYNVNLNEGDISIELLPKKIVSTFDYSLTLTKTEQERYDSFVVVLDNNLYELTSIANSIIEWEEAFGDADTTAYMAIYPNLKVEQKRKSDGSKIYIITERESGNKFQFASRSGVLPPGWGF